MHTAQQQVIYERPPDGMARGKLPVPWWVVASLAIAIVLAATVFLIVRLVVGARIAKDRPGPPPAG
jgi:hypothetical protein